MISIYEKGAVDFGNNGLGTLNPISCTVTETLNGNYEVVLTHPIDEAGKYARIQEERIIKVPVPAGRTPRIAAGVGAGTLRIYKIVTDGRRLYLRNAPSQDAKGIKTYKPGTEVVVIDNETDSKWSEVETPDGKHGWMWTGNLSYVRTEVTNEAADSIKEAVILREQPFRIYKVEPTLKTVTAYARHIFYDLMDNMVSEYKPAKTTTGAAAFIGLAGATEDEHGFTFYSDLDSTAEEVEITNNNPAEAILGDGGLVENYGGELARDWWDVYLVKRVGEETGIQIREGKNLLGIKYSVDITNCATRIIPKGADKDGKPLYLPEKWIENPAEDKAVYINHKYSVLEVKDAKEKTKGDDKRTKEECWAMMRKAAEDAFREGADLPDVTLNVDFIDCAETEEYRQYRNLQGIHMGDTVRVVAKRVGVEVAMRMTQYSYNCLTKRYEKMTLGTIDATIDGNMINPRSIGSGTIKGSMIKLGGIGSGQIEDGAVNGLKIALAAIEYAHIGTAAIDRLSANAITAIRADIRELVAGNITTDQLYADLATIAAAQITAANIEKANIQWAQIENLSAEIAKVVNAEIENLEVDWAGIYEADIEWANITNLTAEIAKITAATIEKAKINWAQIVDVKIGTADIEDATITTAKIALGAITSALIKAGAIGTAQIADGSITEAKIVSLNADVIKSGTLSTDRLLIKGAGGLFYEINATAGGLTSTQLTQEQYKNAISGTALVARSVTADKIAAKTITANEILSGTITAAEINVANLFAADATIAALNNYILRTQTIEAIEGKLDVWASEKIKLAVDNVQVGGRNLLRNTATLKKANYSFNNSSDASAGIGFGSTAEDEYGGFHVVCKNQNVRIEMGTFPVTPGQTYAMSVRYKINSGSAPIQFQYIFRNASANALHYWDSVNHSQVGTRVEDGWTVMSSVFTVPDNAAITTMQLAIRTGKDNTAYTCDYNIRRPQLETGNKATDWSPAPEDTDAAIDELSAALIVQAGEITANATKIETVEQAAGNAQDAANAAQNTANAAQNAANGAQGTANNAVTRVTTAEQRISAVEGAITSKVEKADFDALGNKVSANTSAITQTAEAIRSEVASSVSGLQTQIEQTDEQVLILAGRSVGGTNLIRCAEGTIWVKTGGVNYNWQKSKSCQSGVAAMMLAWSGTHNEVDYESNIDLEPGIYTLSFWSWYASLNVAVTIRPNILGSGYDKYFDQYAFTPNPGVPKRYSFQLEIDYTGRAKFRFVTMTPWPVGEVYFTDVKLEKGNTATDWSPSPDDPASSVMAGSGVLITKDKIKLAAPETEIAIPDTDGERTVAKFDADGLTAERVQAGNVSYRYDGPAVLYVNPNATSAQIAAGNCFRSLGEACAYLSCKVMHYSVTITVQGDQYGHAMLKGINGFGDVTINGGGYTLHGTFKAENCGITVYTKNMRIVNDGGNQSWTLGLWNVAYAEVTNCVIRAHGMNADSECLALSHGTRALVTNSEFYAANHLIWMQCMASMQAHNLRGGDGNNFISSNGCAIRWSGTRPAGAVRPRDYPSACIPTDLSTLPIDYGTAQPSVPVISTASWSYLYSDSYAGKWGIPNQDAAQGVIRTDSSGTTAAVYGTIWFDAAAIRSALTGKTIKQASLRLTMLKGYGRVTTVSVQLYGTNTAYSGRSGQPQLVTSYGTIGATEPGAVSEITIPTAVISDIVNSTIQALVLKSDDDALYKDRDYSKNYARFAGSATADGSTCPRLTVVYQ